MAITLNLEPEVERSFRAEAERLGITLEEYFTEKTCLLGDYCVRRTPSVETARGEAERHATASTGR